MTTATLETPEQIDARMHAIDRILGDRMRPVPGSCYTAWEPTTPDDYPALVAAQERTALCGRYLQVAGSAHPLEHVPGRERLSDRERMVFARCEWIAVGVLAALVVGAWGWWLLAR